MHRREAFAGIVCLMAVPVTACSSGDDDTATGHTNACNGAGANTTNNSDHIHFVCVPKADLDAPPAGGATLDTTTNSGHKHTVFLTNGQLTSIANGMVVTVTTSTDQGHSHQVTLPA